MRRPATPDESLGPPAQTAPGRIATTTTTTTMIIITTTTITIITITIINKYCFIVDIIISLITTITIITIIIIALLLLSLLLLLLSLLTLIFLLLFLVADSDCPGRESTSDIGATHRDPTPRNQIECLLTN